MKDIFYILFLNVFAMCKAHKQERSKICLQKGKLMITF